MPQIVNCIPRDWHYLVDLSLTDFQLLDIIMNNMTFNCNNENPEHIKARAFLTEVWAPFVAHTVDEMEKIEKEGESGFRPNYK